MRVSVYPPMLLSLLLAPSTPLLSRRLAPRLAACVLTLRAGLTAAASSWGLLLLATTLLQHTPEAEEHGALPRPVSAVVAAAALIALTLARRAGDTRPAIAVFIRSENRSWQASGVPHQQRPERRGAPTLPRTPPPSLAVPAASWSAPAPREAPAPLNDR